MLRRPDPQQWLLALGGRELVEAVRVADQINVQYDRRYAHAARKPIRWHEPGQIRQITRDNNRFLLMCESAWVELTLLSAASFCVRLRTLDGAFSLQQATTSIPLTIQDDARSITIQSERLVLIIDKLRYRLRVALLPDKNLIYDDASGVGWSDQGDVRLALRLPTSDLIWGAGALNNVISLRGKRLRIDQLDTAFAARREIETAFPAVIAGARGRTLYGVNWHNVARGWLDIGVAAPEELTFEAEGGELAYTFATSTDPRELMGQLVRDQPDLPPLWAFGFGFGGTRMTSVDQLSTHMQTFQQRDVPCRVVYLDEQKSALAPAQLKPLIDELHAQGLAVMAQIAPTLKIDAPTAPVLVYPDGEPFVGASILGASFWLDFTHPDGQAAWRTRLLAYAQAGVDGVLIAQSPVSALGQGGRVVAPSDHVRQTSGAHHECRHENAHQAYNTAIAAFDQQRAQRRSVVQTRGASAMTWLTLPTTWDGLRQIIPSALNAALTIPFVGVEVGAQMGEPEGELFTRWLQATCLMPLLRAWSPVRQAVEPWAHGQPYQLINRITLKLRQRLTPYLYSLAALRREYRAPMLRPLFTLDLDDAALRGVNDAFMLGDLLVAPVLTKGATSREIYLPRGEWFDFWSHERFEGGRNVRVPAPLEQLPLFVRAGAVLPSQTDADVLTLSAFPGDRETILYEDAGEGHDALDGAYRWVYLTCARIDAARLVIERRTAGRYQPTYSAINLAVMGLEHEPTEVRLDRQGAPLWFFDDGVLELKLDESFRRVEIAHMISPLDRTVPHRPLSD